MEPVQEIDAQGRPAKLCDLCARSFLGDYAHQVLAWHLASHHMPRLRPARESAACDECEQWSSSKKGMEYHFRTSHGVRSSANRASRQPKRHCCDECGKSYGHANAFYKHWAVQHGRASVCQRERHLQRTRPLPFACDVCIGRSFPARAILAVHIISRHPSLLRLTESLFRPQQDQCPTEAFVCDDCSHCFSSQRPIFEMRRHAAVHQSRFRRSRREGTLACDDCGSTVDRQDRMSAHWASAHTPDGPKRQQTKRPRTFACDDCGKAITVVKEMAVIFQHWARCHATSDVAHLLRRTRTARHCDNCDLSFKATRAMRRHGMHCPS